MKEEYNMQGMALNYLECTICNERVKSCDWCGEDFLEKQEIIHIQDDDMGSHFCSEECHVHFRNVEEVSEQMRGYPDV